MFSFSFKESQAEEDVLSSISTSLKQGKRMRRLHHESRQIQCSVVRYVMGTCISSGGVCLTVLTLMPGTDAGLNASSCREVPALHTPIMLLIAHCAFSVAVLRCGS